MQENWLVLEANKRFSEILRQSRREKGETVTEAALALGLSEMDFARLERNPAYFPCSLLYRAIRRLGPAAHSRAQRTWAKIQATFYLKRFGYPGDPMTDVRASRAALPLSVGSNADRGLLNDGHPLD